jgi:hypothetical protein
MEKWNCPHCGEEMLGAVNRCWNCGERISQPAEAVVVAEPPGEVAADAASPDGDADQWSPLTVDEVAVAIAGDPPRRGSPFAHLAELAPAKPFAPQYGAGPYRQPPPAPAAPAPRETPKPQYPKDGAAIGATVASVALGIVSVGLSLYTVLAFVTSVIGILMGIWGLKSDRKLAAICGLLLCSVAMFLTAWFFAFSVYEFFTSGQFGGGSGW